MGARLESGYAGLEFARIDSIFTHVDSIFTHFDSTLAVIWPYVDRNFDVQSTVIPQSQ